VCVANDARSISRKLPGGVVMRLANEVDVATDNRDDDDDDDIHTVTILRLRVDSL